MGDLLCVVPPVVPVVPEFVRRTAPRAATWQVGVSPEGTPGASLRARGRARNLLPPRPRGRPPLLSLRSLERHGLGLRGALRALCGSGPTASARRLGGDWRARAEAEVHVLPSPLLRAPRCYAAEATSLAPWRAGASLTRGFVLLKPAPPTRSPRDFGLVANPSRTLWLPFPAQKELCCPSRSAAILPFASASRERAGAGRRSARGIFCSLGTPHPGTAFPHTGSTYAHNSE